MRDKQGIPLLQMFAQCALHGAALEAAQSCIIWDAAIHQASRSVDLEVSFSYPTPPDQVAAIQQSICLAYGLQGATLHQPQPGGAAHSGAGSRAGFRTHSSAGGTRLGRRRRR